MLSLETVGEESTDGDRMIELPGPEEAGRTGKDCTCCPEGRTEEIDVDRAPFALPKEMLLDVGEALGKEYVNDEEMEITDAPIWPDVRDC